MDSKHLCKIFGSKESSNLKDDLDFLRFKTKCRRLPLSQRCSAARAWEKETKSYSKASEAWFGVALSMIATRSPSKSNALVGLKSAVQEFLMNQTDEACLRFGKTILGVCFLVKNLKCSCLIIRSLVCFRKGSVGIAEV